MKTLTRSPRFSVLTVMFSKENPDATGLVASAIKKDGKRFLGCSKPILLPWFTAVAVGLIGFSAYASDTYDGTYLTIPVVQVLGGAVYNNVKITLTKVVSAGGGTPITSYDIYNLTTNELTIPSVTYGSNTYTNVVIVVGTVVSVGDGISGSVTNIASAPMNAIPLVLSGGATQSTATDTSGNYTFSGLSNGRDVVKPADALYKFKPASRAVNLAGSAVGGQNFVAKSSSSPNHILSGVVSGAVVQNVTVTLNGDNTGSTFTDAGGNYSFTGLDAGNYTVSAQLPGYSFNIPSPVSITTTDSQGNNFVAKAAPAGTINLMTVNPMLQATVGVAYTNTTVGSISGGSPPYHYQSDTFANGAPPFGMIVDLNGNLTGTPTDAGQYTFGVCAVDSSGRVSAPCPMTTITVVSVDQSAGQMLLSLQSVSCVPADPSQGTDTFSYTVSVSGPVGAWVEDGSGASPPISETSCGAWTAGSGNSVGSCSRGPSDPSATTAVFSGGAVIGNWYGNPIANYPFSWIQNLSLSPTATCP